MRRLLIIGVIVVALVAGGTTWALLGSRGYEVRVALPTAPGIVSGGIVKIDGVVAGTVQSVEPENDHAFVTLELEDEFAPLHDGVKVMASWKAAVGERHVDIEDGKRTNAAIPDGGMVKGTVAEFVEVDKILAALDPRTRERLKSMLGELDKTLEGSAADVNRTIQGAAPALKALGDVLSQLGSDATGIKTLISNLHQMIGTLADRDGDIKTIVQGLSSAAQGTAKQRVRLGQALKQLPRTLETASGTLGDVPRTADKVIPLLRSLQPATKKLPELSRNLSPVLRDLRPLVGKLKPTLESANELLRYSPTLMDSAHGVLPPLNSTLKDILPALDFVRPYTPEMIGFFSNWASAAANYDVNGHYARTSATAGATTLDANPGVVPPGTQYDPYPVPGAAENQPWNDAYGDGMR